MTMTHHTNGPETDYRHIVEQTVGRFDAAVKECKQLKEDLDQAKALIARAEAQISVLKGEIKDLRSERGHYQLERDQAVAQRAVYETLFASMQAQMRAFKIPATPLVKSNGDETVPTMGQA